MAASTSHHHSGASSAAASAAAIPSPPPPTPSNHSLANPVPSDADAALSRFLHQMLLVSPPPLLLPRTCAPPPSSPPAPLVSLRNPRRDLLLSAAADLGFFHLADHGVPAHLHASALLESRSLLVSPSPPDLSPLGFPQIDDDDDDDDDDGKSDPILVLDVDDRGDREGLRSLVEYGRCLKRAAMGVVGMLGAVGGGGFEVDPFGEGMSARCLMWVSTNRGRRGAERGEERTRSKGYPYVVGLRYEAGEPSWVHVDSGEWVAAEPRDDSVLVTLGDIAQVWSNGRFKKVAASCNESSEISITLLLTLPLDSTISPLSPWMEVEDEECEQWNIDSIDDDHGTSSSSISSSSSRRFRSFSLDEYAWRVYHERPPFKDPLIRYRI